MDKEHVLLFVVGKSAVGKDTIVKELCERANLTSIVSYTTRPRRLNESDTHIFTNVEEYESMQQNGQVAAYTEIAGNIYWTTTDQLYEHDIYIIDPAGIKTLKNMDLPNMRFVIVYIKASDEERQFRAEKRGDDKNVFRKRSFAEAAQFREFVRDEVFDYAISSTDFAKAYSTLRWISDVEGVWKNHIEGDENQ